MVLLIGGWVLIIASIFYLIFKLLISYQASRDPLSAGGVPILDGIVFPPIFFTLGLSFVVKNSATVAMSGFGYAIVWIVSTALALVGLVITQVIRASRRPR